MGELSFKYLGVPLVSSNLSMDNHKCLIEKILGRIISISRSFTYVRRLILIKATLFSVQVYWSSFLILPSKILKEIDDNLRAFFLGKCGNHKAKVAWEYVYVLKDEGGLGLMTSKEWNRATATKNLWNLLQPNSESFWVNWIKKIHLKRKNLLESEATGECPW